MGTKDIAIIGMSCRIPGADGIGEFEDVFRTRRCVITDIPKARAELVGGAGEKYMKFGYLENIEMFDNEFFGMTGFEAMSTDPQQRIMLQLAQELFDDAGYTRKGLEGSNVSVNIAASDDDYKYLIDGLSAVSFIGVMPAFIAGRISDHYGLRGPSQVIDTTCSSSLMAIHSSCMQLLSGEADMSVAGGIQLCVFPIKASQDDVVGIASGDGLTRSFDAEANGTGGGEGAGLVLLKRLDDAVRDNDHIYAVIKGSAVNSDGGRGSNISAPSSEGQAEVIRMALEKSGVSPEQIGYLEAHGTATRIGDPIEVRGVSDAYSGFTDRKQWCALGAAKSNLGHTSMAAGILGMIKSVCAVYYGRKYPICHFSKPNPLIDFASSPLYPCTVTEDWDESPRFCAISSFGLSGTNVHMIIGSYEKPEQKKSSGAERELPFPVSAMTEASLRANIARLRDYVEKSSADLENISYTLCCRRDSYKYRAFAAASTREELLIKLSELENEKTSPAEGKIAVLISGDSLDGTSEEVAGYLEKCASLSEGLKQCSSVFLANSRGNIALRVIGGSMTAEQGAAGCMELTDLQKVNKEALTKHLRSYISEGYVFAELFEKGIIGRITEELGGRVISLGGLSDTEIIGTLWRLGAGPELYSGSNAEAVTLPPYAFDLHRYWPEVKNMTASAGLPGGSEAEESAGSTVKETVRGIWEELLSDSSFADDDDFFEIGGSSLMIMRMINRIKKLYGVDLEFDDIDDNSTVDDLSALIESRMAAAEGSVSSGGIVHAVREKNPLSHEQNSMICIYERDRDSAAYNMTSFFRLKGSVDTSYLEKAFRCVVAGNEVLHSIYVKEDGEYYSVPASEELFSFKVEDMSGKTADEALGFLHRKAAVPFVLESQLPIRCAAAVISANEAYLLFQLHHIAGDNWSAELIVGQLCEYYRQLLENGSITNVIREEYTYSDYSVWQKELIAGERGRKMLGFWKDYLASPPELPVIPTDFPRSGGTAPSAGTSAVLSPELTQKLQSYMTATRSSLYAVMLAAYSTLIHRYTAMDDLCIGITSANRPGREAERIIGYFANTLVLRSSFGSGDSFNDIVERTKNDISRVLSNQEIPFDMLVSELNPPRNSTGTPFFSHLFTELFNSDAYSGLDINMEQLPPERGDAKFDIMMSVGQSADGRVTCVLEYNAGLYTKETMDCFLGNYMQLLEAMLDNSQAEADMIAFGEDEDEAADDYEF